MNFVPELKNMSFAKFNPATLINVDHPFRHYGHFVSGQHCVGGGGYVLPGIGILENSPRTVKCLISFATDCRLLPLDQGQLIQRPIRPI